jgi:hypothetical protein
VVEEHAPAGGQRMRVGGDLRERLALQADVGNDERTGGRP